MAQDKQKAIEHAGRINANILRMMSEVNELGIEIAYNGALDGAPDWIDHCLDALETASDILEQNLDLDNSVAFGDLDEEGKESK
ncbi:MULTISPECIES: hypothetical protein [Shuttleworthella]|uniref:Uncharacterized protein n=1 Tax=Shuttleworthella satelles DSM 14600 TaxID=626523 RepID=C4G7X2_9FIRM|nr:MULTISPECIES: hypothetical protein [Shuttleworthia]EEP28768.1 hypothetical protein GCWU000342_00109 [Shuttleworthia satelles DSM 14600]EUB12412.1 hypothetical protein HMPREF1508_0083 [Shuttleworthia sp. MSX8B]